MAADDKQQATQQQTSRQSGSQGGQSGAERGDAPSDSPEGMGSSQGHDSPSREERQPRERPSAGTPDIERQGEGGGDRVESNRSDENSLTGDPTGAYKERP